MCTICHMIAYEMIGKAFEEVVQPENKAKPDKPNSESSFEAMELREEMVSLEADHSSDKNQV